MLLAPPPDLSIVILSWNTRELLRECLDAVRRATTSLTAEIIVIDNASADGSADMVATSFPEVRIERNKENRGYAGGVNQGLRLSHGKKIALLGSDTRPSPGSFQKLCAFLDARPEVGAIAPRLINPDGTIQRACMRFPTLRTALYWDTPLGLLWPNSKELRRYQMKDWDHVGTREVDQPPGTCVVIRRRILDLVGFMDERLWLFFNDVDWSLRIRRHGYQIWYLEDAEVIHHLGGSTRHYTDFAAEWHRNRIQFYRKHFHALGNWLTKTVLLYVGLRQCWRIRKDVKSRLEYHQHCRQLLTIVWNILRT